jgi:exportin-1
MRGVKKEVLNLISTFITRSEDARAVAQHFIPPLLEPVLGDYATSRPSVRDPEVMNLMAESIAKLRGEILPVVPRILEAVFEPTLAMITSNFSDFPEHRMAFFRLLEAINGHCFSALFAIPPPHQKLVIDSVCWAFKHTERNIGEMGLHILASLLENVAAAGPDIAQPFYAGFFLSLLQDLLGVLTDRLHRAHFKEHAGVLRHLCHLVESGAVATPLWESAFAGQVGAAASYQAKVAAAAAAAGGTLPPGALSNQQFVREYIRMLVATSFSNLKP